MGKETYRGGQLSYPNNALEVVSKILGVKESPEMGD